VLEGKEQNRFLADTIFLYASVGSGKGYRFENAAASQTKLSPSVSPSLDTVNKILESPTSVRETPSTSSSQITSPSTEPPSNNIPAFLKFDPSPNQTPPPAERREKSRAIISRMGSPPSADSESMDMGRRLRAHMRSDSSSSIRSTSSNRIPHARLKSHENSNRRSHWRNSSAISLSYQDGQMEAVLDQKRENRRSATVIGVVEAQNASPITIPTGPHHMPSSSSASSLQSPSRFAAMQGHPPVSARRGLYGSPPSPVMPRTSSLHGHTNPSLAGTSRTSSATNASFASAGSPVGVVNESLADEDQSSLPTSDIPIQGRGAVAESTSVAAILAKLSQLGDGEKDQESKGDLTTLSSVDTVSESISRDSEMDRTMTAEAPRMPEQKRVQQLSEEPKRPMKSPLRKISATTVNSLASTPSSVPLSPAKTVFGSDRPATVSSLAQSDSTRSIETSVNRIARKFDPSPPRHSLDDVAQLRALADSHFATLSTSRSRESATNEPVQVQPVPQSAKRLVDVTGSLERRDNLLPNESTNSLVTIQDRTDDLVTNASNMSLATEEDVNSESPADENTATRKTKMPVLATAFSRSGPGSRTASLIEQGTEDEAEDGSPSTISAKRKNKKWPFHSKDSPHEVTEMDRRVPSMGAKMANSLRGRKSESQSSSKLMIRRVYDETRLDEGQDEPMRVTSSDTTIVHSPAVPASAFFKERRDTDASLFSIDSGPNTPVMAHEEMTPEVKKLVHRRNVIRELVETEKSYSSDLAVVRDIYLARAKSVVGLSIASSLQTPLSGHSGHGTPTGTPTSLSNLGSRSSPLHTVHRNLQRMASSELKPPPSPPTGQSHPKASPSSSSEPSNRSSTYTVSSQTSQASDSSFPFNASSAPPLPATPPNLAKLNSTPSGNTLHAPSPSSITSASTVSGARNPSNKPKMQVSTTSLPQYQSSPIQTANDIGFTVTDLRVMFSHLEACCAFSEDMSSVLAGCMGTFARSKRLDSADVTVDMDKEDDRLGETFLQLMPRIRKVYINYCSRHEAGMLRLQEILAASPKASAIFKESTELARKHTNAWDLASLLIKPVQRVLKYPLLIQQILNGTAKTHPDYAQLSLAFEEIQAVADEINHVKRRKDLAETLIIGRTKEPKGVMASTSTMKGKKKLDISTDDGLLTPLGGEDSALEEYAELVKDFHTLADYVSRFSSQCTTWTRSLRESHESQISVMRGVRRLYRLQVEEVGQDGVTRAKENKESIKGEERLTAKYTKLLQTLLAESCRQIDRSVRLNILPRIVQIADLFEAPQTVMAKRDERQADYQRYRLNLLGGRQSDRKVMENANGFIALNAQLVEELPLFLQGVRTLLEATVYSFARLQAAHFQEVRNQTLTYWRDVAKKSDEVEVDKDTGVIKLKTINSVRVFWNRHSVSAAWVDSLGIVRRNVGMIVEDGNNSTGSASTTPAMTSTARMPSGSHPIESSEAKVSVADAMMKKSVNGDLPSSEMNDYHMPYNSVQAQRAMQARRPTVVGNLMRTISGTFAKDQDGEVIPPLPAGAGSRQVSTSSAKFNSPAPMLPNLTFKDKEGESGYFVQSGPVPFLDTISKQPYESSSPANDEISRSLSSYEEATSRSSQLHGRNDSIMSSISIQAVDPKQALPAEESGDTPRRQRMNVLYVCVAIADSQQELQGRTHLGWPFIPFVKNDTLRVLSSSDSAATPLLFGRIDRTGETGWAEKRCF
jgi:hypothetical protein